MNRIVLNRSKTRVGKPFPAESRFHPRYCLGPVLPLGRTNTWGGELQHHPHLHCVLPAGGLAPDRSRWVPCRPDFFLPVRVLSRRFRRLFPDGLKHLYGQGELTLTGRCRDLAEPKPWKRLLAALRDQEWVVYAKEPCDSEHILKYLARYTHRVAISNHRLVALQDGQVTFRFKDHKRGGQLRTRTLGAVEFFAGFACIFCLRVYTKSTISASWRYRIIIVMQSKR
ncbi:MAG: transposase [Candidatus Tectomicrobia bacterium]|nr:transposase [Candidatus Tectomicrobia bacterium]